MPVPPPPPLPKKNVLKVLGIVVEHEGKEYLVCVDDKPSPKGKRYPSLKVRIAGGWTSLKRKRVGSAGDTAAEILGYDPGHHTQPNIRTLATEAIATFIRTMFGGAWGG